LYFCFPKPALFSIKYDDYAVLKSSIALREILELLKQEVGCGGKDWIELAEDRDRWQALVNAVMNFYILLTVHPEAIVGFQPT
jgi:hypothetical protein